MPKLLTADETLGYTFKDKVTGFQGVCTGYTIHLTGCNRVTLEPGVQGGRMGAPFQFDVTSVELIQDVPRIVINAEAPETKTEAVQGSYTEQRPGGPPTMVPRN